MMHSVRKWSQQELSLFLALFAVGLASKGLALAQGFSTDDYSFTINTFTANRDGFLAQGRIISWLALSVIEKLGVNIVDCGLLFGLTAIAMQSALAIYAIRYVGLRTLPTAFVCGGIIALHPYTVEIFTFKLALPTYIICLFFLIAAIEYARRGTISATSFFVVTAFISLALLVYQLAFNFILAVAICGFLAALLSRPVYLEKSRQLLRASLLLITSLLFSGVLHVLLLKGLRYVGVIKSGTPRSMLIQGSEIPTRLNQILDLLGMQYLRSEPVLRTPLKVLLLALLISALILIVVRLSAIYGLLLALAIALSLTMVWSIASIGVIIAFQDWHPAPRVLSHVSILTGLTLLNAFNYAIPTSVPRSFHRGLVALCAFIVLGYALMGNQILSDQQRLNHWDSMLANRIAGRLEALPGYEEVRKIVIYGGARNFGKELKTTQIDMNISAFSKEWSKVAVFSEATGKNITVVSELDDSKQQCKSMWPDKNAVYISGTTAFVCLPYQVLH